MVVIKMAGHKQTAATKRKIAKSVTGKSNSQYKDGRRSYRRIAGMKNKDGNLVHHVDGNRSNNSKSNLQKISPANRGKHDKAHHRERSFKKKSGTKKGAHTKRSHPSRIR